MKDLHLLGAESRTSAFLAFVLCPLFLVAFFGLFLIFHPLFVVTHLVSARLYQRTIELGNFCLLLSLRIVHARVIVDLSALPPRGSFIFVSNHQSLFDIPILLWHLRAYQPKFIAKRELGVWLPSVSHALRHMGSVLIDRSDKRQSIAAISSFAERAGVSGSSPLIFPEGTRARDGNLKPFRTAGLAALLDKLPHTAVVPLVIDGTWKLSAHNLLPVPFGVRVHLRALAPIQRAPNDRKSLPGIVESSLRQALQQESESASLDIPSQTPSISVQL